MAAPEGGFARWVRTADDIRLRVALWPQGSRGTVLIFPGRTEYIEKYAHAAAAMSGHGFASVAVDWRGQGLSDRLLRDPVPGHVAHFPDYQHDVAAALDLARAAGLPEPFHLLAHSMGSCIGLRTMMEGGPVRAAAFSGPMWGIRIRPLLRPVAWALAWIARAGGFGSAYAPTTGPASYVATAPFEDNVLTQDAGMFAMMKDHLVRHPEFTIGGPTMAWLLAALREVRALRLRASPAAPCYTAYGGNERVIDVPAVEERMSRWPGGSLEVYPGAEHELVVETPPRRTRFFDAAAQLFQANGGG